MPTSATELSIDRIAERPALLGVGFREGVRRWRWIAGTTVVFGLIGVPVAMRVPLWFAAGVRMVPTPSRHHDSKLPGFEPVEGATPDDISGPGGAEGAAELGRLLSVLHSRSLTDDTIRKFDLMKVYGAKNIEDMRDLFWNRLATANLVAKEGYVELSLEDQSPARSAAIANYMAQGANLITRRISSSAASQERGFLEQRLEEARLELEQAAEAYRDFQQKNKVVNIDVQADGVMATTMRLNEQLIAEQLELNRLRGFSSKDEPATVVSRRRVRALRAQIAQLQGQLGSHSDFFTRLEAVPELRQEGDRLAREVKVKTGVHELLLREHELAKLAEVRDTRSFEVLDPAVVATRKSRPSRSLVVIGFALLGFGLAFGVALGKGMWPHLRRTFV